jgi:hypothetical protein
MPVDYSFDLGHCDLFVICYLRFGIFHRNVNVSSSIKLEAVARGIAEPGTVQF